MSTIWRLVIVIYRKMDPMSASITVIPMQASERRPLRRCDRRRPDRLCKPDGGSPLGRHDGPQVTWRVRDYTNPMACPVRGRLSERRRAPEAAPALSPPLIPNRAPNFRAPRPLRFPRLGRGGRRRQSVRPALAIRQSAPHGQDQRRGDPEILIAAGTRATERKEVTRYSATGLLHRSSQSEAGLAAPAAFTAARRIDDAISSAALRVLTARAIVSPPIRTPSIAQALARRSSLEPPSRPSATRSAIFAIFVS